MTTETLDRNTISTSAALSTTENLLPNCS